MRGGSLSGAGVACGVTVAGRSLAPTVLLVPKLGAARDAATAGRGARAGWGSARLPACEDE